jgi:glycosyltransferase involved in cell wall biosynthesis
MKVGVFYPTRITLSARNYVDNVINELVDNNVELFTFAEKDPIPASVDIYWDPRSMGGGAPYKMFMTTEKPLVVTVHGASPFALAAKEHFSNFRSALISQYFKIHHLYEWRQFRHRSAAFIAVSAYGKWEITKYLHLDETKITPVWHGVDLDLFKPNLADEASNGYFLHISQYQPKKNVDRIIEAYAKLSVANKPALVAVVPGYPQSDSVPKGIELMRTPKDQQELAGLYRNAVAFVFPSLHETFGMPIIEAMASGSPVITSNVTACPEIAGDAALLVNPRSVDDIAAAMDRLLADESLRERLREKGLARAQQFTWQYCAEKHVKVFERAIRDAKNS